ncbi:nitrogen regulation protein NR(II) [Comamonas odontotermitis]|uniref:two-component system sensor histidine kinase NtrB n=1 Tax=Comamonas odontotermitis TaxID=379895 RepID=UPI00366FCF1D
MLMTAWARWTARRWHYSWRRWSLWLLLMLLVAGMLVMQVWLAGRYEVSEVQQRLDREAADAVADIRTTFNSNVNRLRTMPRYDSDVMAWQLTAADMLRNHRNLAHIEWRNPQMQIEASEESPYLNLQWSSIDRTGVNTESNTACMRAQRSGSASYAGSYFLSQGNGTGLELLELCTPVQSGERLHGFVVVTYILQNVLTDLVNENFRRNHELSFTEPDGTRLAIVSTPRRGTRVFTATQLLDLPGATLMLRIDSWHAAPNVFPNVLTALVTGMSIALVTVLVVLVRDNRKRLKAERDLGDALAFRKAMEDSLVTGLRARDLQGKTTYVNPAFCEMVGFTAEEILDPSRSTPYWPPELAPEYARRQRIRLSGQLPPAREGYESTFMRKDGVRFPVLIFEAPLINAAGLHTGWMSAFVDMSEQRRVEELSRASQERLQATARLATVGEMASLLSHELNQPLAAISSYATGTLNLLPENAPADELQAYLPDVRMAVQRMAFQAERAGRVIKSVHDFVRRRGQARELVPPQELLDAVLPLVRLQGRKLQVEVVAVLAPDVPAVYCDRTMVEQVLLNLSRNGMQAMDSPGCEPRLLRMDVRLANAQGDAAAGRAWVEFAVTDWGVGISGEVAQQLYTPFFTTKDEGMGLGLSLCRTVVEQHGSHLVHHDNSPQGTIFSFTLPTWRND